MFLYIFMDASHLFVKALENEGVEYIFGIPGEENLPLLEAIRTSSIREEQACVFPRLAPEPLTSLLQPRTAFWAECRW